MRYLLLFLLFCNGMFAQQQFKNTTKVLACRLVNSDENGPCSIQYYAKKLKRTGHYIQAMESYSDTLAYSLLQLKADAKSWDREPCNCGEESAGTAFVTNMFIIEVNSQRDTVFTTPDNKAVFFPKEQQKSIDPDNRITSAYTKEILAFLKRDFASEIEAWKPDSIPAQSIVLMKKPFYGLTRKQFEKEVSIFDVARTDSVYDPYRKLFQTVKAYFIDDIKFGFDAVGGIVSEVLISNSYANNGLGRTKNISVDGVKIGDPEEVLCSKYDNSTLLKYWDAPLAAIGNYYTYELYLDHLEGKIMYTIRNKIIQSIHIEFRYPNGLKKKKAKK